MMFWGGGSSLTIRLANLDGSGQAMLVNRLNTPWGIALDLGAQGTAVFYAIAAPASVPSGTAFDVTITAADPYGTIDVNYQPDTKGPSTSRNKGTRTARTLDSGGV
jgi:hypothetical protein